MPYLNNQSYFLVKHIFTPLYIQISNIKWLKLIEKKSTIDAFIRNTEPTAGLLNLIESP